MSPQGPGTAGAHAHGGKAWRLEPNSVACYPSIIRQGILLSLVLTICLKELLSVCFQGEAISQTVLRA